MSTHSDSPDSLCCVEIKTSRFAKAKIVCERSTTSILIPQHRILVSSFVYQLDSAIKRYCISGILKIQQRIRKFECLPSKIPSISKQIVVIRNISGLFKSALHDKNHSTKHFIKAMFFHYFVLCVLCSLCTCRYAEFSESKLRLERL